jgi:hypothetical protein
MIRGAAFLIDHDVLGLEVAVDDTQLVRLLKTVAHLPGDTDRLTGAQPPDLPDKLLEVFAMDILHGDVASALILTQVEHLTDVLVTDLPGEFELVREPLEGPPVQAGFGPDELQGDLLADLGVLDFVDPAHAAVAKFLDDLVTPGKEASCREFLARRLQRFGDPGGPLVSQRGGGWLRRWNWFRRRERSRALLAEFGIRRIICVTRGTLHNAPIRFFASATSGNPGSAFFQRSRNFW